MFETGNHPMMSSRGLGKVAPAHPCARDISTSLYVTVPAYPCARSISAWPRPASRPAGLTFSLHCWKAPESEAKMEVT